MASLSDATLQRLAAALREPLGFDRAKAEWLAEQLLQAGERGMLVAPNVLLDAYSRAKVRRGAGGCAAAVLPCRYAPHSTSVCSVRCCRLSLHVHDWSSQLQLGGSDSLGLHCVN